MDSGEIALVPAAVNAPPPIVAYTSITPVVLTRAKPTAPPPLSVILATTSLSADGKTAAGAPVKVKVVALEVPVIVGMSSVTVFPFIE